MFLAFFFFLFFPPFLSDGRNLQNLACQRTKNIPASGGQYPRFWFDSFLASIICLRLDWMERRTWGETQQKTGGRKKGEGGTWKGPGNPHCPAASVLTVQRQRHHVVVGGTSEEEGILSPTRLKKGLIDQNCPKGLKNLEKDITLQFFFIWNQKEFLVFPLWMHLVSCLLFR